LAGHDHGHDVTYRLDRDLSIPELSTTGSATSSGKAGMVMYRARGEASWMALAWGGHGATAGGPQAGLPSAHARVEGERAGGASADPAQAVDRATWPHLMPFVLLLPPRELDAHAPRVRACARTSSSSVCRAPQP